MFSGFFTGDKIKKYILSKEGKHVSTDCENEFRKGTKYYNVKYYDKRGNLRKVTYSSGGLFNSFDNDEIIQYSSSSSEYKEFLKQQEEIDNKARNFNQVVYKVTQGELTIKQEYTNPNVGEFVYINGCEAPNGLYKLGFMNYITIENGKIKEFSFM